MTMEVAIVANMVLGVALLVFIGWMAWLDSR